VNGIKDMSDEVDVRYAIGDDEMLFRLISYPGCFDEENHLSPDVFSLYHKNEDYVSVSREFYVSMNDFMSFGPQIKKWCKQGDKYYGCILLNARKIRCVSERIDLRSHYEENNKPHAGIHYLQGDGTSYMNKGYGELTPAWIMAIQIRLCKIVDRVVKAYMM